MKFLQWGFISSIIVFVCGCSGIPKSVEQWRSGLKYQKVGSETMAYKTYGDITKPAVVLLHGLPTSSYLYRNIAPKIAEQGFYVITPDFIGFGASTKPTETTAYEMSLQADRLSQLLAKLDVQHYSVVAHDMGGLVGFELLVSHADQIQTFFVLNTTAYTDGFTPPPEMKMLAGRMGGLMTSMMSNGVTGEFLTAKFIKDNMGHPERLSQEAKENYWWPMHEGTTQPMRATAKTFDKIMGRYPVYQEALKAYHGSSRVLWGAKDKVLNFEKLTAQFARDLRLPSEKIQRIDDAGHFLQEDYPDVVAANVLLLLGEVK
jgi:haloalkane dehalogenase